MFDFDYAHQEDLARTCSKLKVDTGDERRNRAICQAVEIRYSNILDLHYRQWRSRETARRVRHHVYADVREGCFLPPK